MINLGVDVSPKKFVETVIVEDCFAIVCPALLTTTIPVMSDVVKAAEEAGTSRKNDATRYGTFER